MQPETLNRSIQPTPTVHPRGFTPTCVQYWKAANTEEQTGGIRRFNLPKLELIFDLRHPAFPLVGRVLPRLHLSLSDDYSVVPDLNV